MTKPLLLAYLETFRKWIDTIIPAVDRETLRIVHAQVNKINLKLARAVKAK